MRNRAVIFIALVIGAAALGGGYVIWAVTHDASARPVGAKISKRTAAALAAVRSEPHVVFRSLARDDRFGARTFGRVAIASRANTGRRVLAPFVCERVYVAAGRGICLEGFRRRLSYGYRATIFDGAFRRRGSVPVGGFPSRARVSPDGRFGATTVFVAGHSYGTPGSFSTETLLLDLERGKKIANLESFFITRRGRRIVGVDFNFWGVTFARDSDRFYATLATGGDTYLIEGSVSRRRARVLRANVECPSLSPDNTRVAYKKRVRANPPTWRYHVLDLRTGRDTPLAEKTSIDDQIEWLDNQNVLYHRSNEIWTVPADGTGAPRRFLGFADSPAVGAPQ